MTTSNDSRVMLADVILLIQNSYFDTRKKQDLLSAVRTAARLIGALPEAIPAEPALLRRKLANIAPAAHGLSAGRWANIRSLVGRAIGLVRPMLPGRSLAPLLPAWRTLVDRLSENRKIRVQPLLRFLSARGIGPGKVSLEDLEAYRLAILEDRLRDNPETSWDGLLWCWNLCVREIPEWPAITIERASRRDSYIMPWETFPDSFHEDCRRYLRRGSAVDLDDDGPVRPMRASTLKTWDYRLRVAASILVHQGTDAQSIRSIADLVSLARIRLILGFMLARHDQKPTAGVTLMATFLKALATHWAKLDEPDLKTLKAIIGRLGGSSRGLTVKNRTRLRAFDDPAAIERFFAIPEQIRRDLDANKGAPRSRAIKAQMAVAIAILQVAPIRLKNLVNLELEKHLIGRGNRLYLSIEEVEVKNTVLIDIELPPQTVEVIAWYLREHRPCLLREPGPYLFPGEAGAKSPNGLTTQIKQAVFQYSGLVVNTHLFRHASAKVFLDARPGEYEVMRQVLGHKSINTTTSFYAGAETRTASEHFVRVVAGRREANQAANMPILPPKKTKS